MDNEKLPAILFSADGSQILHGAPTRGGKTYAMERWKNLQEDDPVTPEEMPHMENVKETLTIEDVGDRQLVTYAIEGDLYLPPPADNGLTCTFDFNSEPAKTVIIVKDEQGNMHEVDEFTDLPDHVRQCLQEAEAGILKSLPEGAHLVKSGQAKQIDKAELMHEVVALFDDMIREENIKVIEPHQLCSKAGKNRPANEFYFKGRHISNKRWQGKKLKSHLRKTGRR